VKRPRWQLDGKVVLITGGGRGIGAAVAGELARRGAVPVLADVDKDALAEAAAAIGGDVLTVVADVSDYASCEAAVAAALDKHGRLDAVWANAGIGAGGPVQLTSAEVWARVIQVNLVGAHNTVKAALTPVIEARGHVMFTASLASFVHPPGVSAYAASKAGVEALADALRAEVAHEGVTVGVLHPTWFATDLVREGDEQMQAFRRLRESMRPPFAKTYPLDAIVGPVADAFAERTDRVFLPRFVRLAHILRPIMNSRAVTRDQLKAAPEMLRLFREQVERDGADAAAVPKRWRDDVR
jgi:NAD(P)-dependent dehydrogenase (short-subunit alcohol dehydrogenase family)